MSKVKFDPDKPSVKVRGMNGIHYVQDGKKFSSGYAYLGPADGSPPPKEKEQKKAREDVRKRAAAKIAAKRGKPEDDPLDGFRGGETPDAVAGALKENEAAKQAEENA